MQWKIKALSKNKIRKTLTLKGGSHFLSKTQNFHFLQLKHIYSES